MLTVIAKEPDAVRRALTVAVQPANTAEQTSRQIVRRVADGGMTPTGMRVERHHEKPRLAAARGPKAARSPKQSKRA
jgi:hypothetical protein